MKVLIVKTSSMGDVIHTLPAVADAAHARPGIIMDWVVEESFAEIPSWHPSIRRVIPVALRRWRKNPLATLRSEEWKIFRQQISAEPYDVVIDAQGLLKSAFVARLANGPVAGFDRQSVREPLASLFYAKTCRVRKAQHAVERTRQLFAQVLGYTAPATPGSAGLRRQDFGRPNPQDYSVLFLHGTTRADKHWPDEHWIELCRHLTAASVKVRLPWYNEIEKERAEKIARVSSLAEVLPKSNLKTLAQALSSSSAFVAVDTGLGHLGAALDVPGLSLYGPTDPALVGAYGTSQLHLQGESMQAISADAAFEKVKLLFPRSC